MNFILLYQDIGHMHGHHILIGVENLIRNVLFRETNVEYNSEYVFPNNNMPSNNIYQ